MSQKKYMTRKDRREKNKAVRRYIWYKFMSTIGYIPRAVFIYLRNFLYKKSFLKTSAVVFLLITLGASFIIFDYSSKISELNDDKDAYVEDLVMYNDKVRELMNENNDIQDEVRSYQYGATERYNYAYSRLENLFERMYSYDSSEEYMKQREKGVEIFKDGDTDWVKDLYEPVNPKDPENLIDAIGISSEYRGMELYTTTPEAKDDVEDMVAVVYHKGWTDNSKKVYHSHTAVYKIKFDLKNLKIEDMSLIGAYR